MKRLAIYQLKGGVGKTTTAVNLAWMAARDGWSTLLWDLDPQGAATYMFEADAEAPSAKRLLKDRQPTATLIRGTAWEGLDLLPAGPGLRHLDTQLHSREAGRGWLADSLAGLAEDYDLVILDCPPSLSHLADNVLAAVDLVLMPTEPSPLSVRAYAQVREHLDARRNRHAPVLRPFLNMVDRRRMAHQEFLLASQRYLPGLSPVTIPASAAIERMSLMRAPLPCIEPPGHVAVQAYEALWRDTQRQLQAL